MQSYTVKVGDKEMGPFLTAGAAKAEARALKAKGFDPKVVGRSVAESELFAHFGNPEQDIDLDDDNDNDEGDSNDDNLDALFNDTDNDDDDDDEGEGDDESPDTAPKGDEDESPDTAPRGEALFFKSWGSHRNKDNQ